MMRKGSSQPFQAVSDQSAKQESPVTGAFFFACKKSLIQVVIFC